MKRLLLILLLFPGLVMGGGEADDLLQRVRALHQADTVVANYRIHIVRPDWHRWIHLQAREDQRAGFYVARLSKPRKLKGTQFLKAGGKLWMYMPRLRRRIGISPAMMLEPWMGSDLTNQDLLQADALVDAYEHTLVASEEVDGFTVHTIRSIPKDGAAVVWGHLEQKIRADGVPLRVDYFEPDGRLARRITFSEPKAFAGRLLPTRWRITPMPDSGSYTEVFVDEVRFNTPLPEGTFARLPAGVEKG
jgi:outer membrane lipoprotein-sorting protein